MRRNTRSADIFAFARIDLNLSSGDLTDSPSGQVVSDNFFSALGATPLIGRGFRADDGPAAVLSHRYWQSRFHGDPAIAGRAITLNGLPFTVAGVMPRRFFGIEPGA